MTPAEVAAERLHLAEVPGSVGEYLATPGMIAPPRRAAGAAGMTAALAASAAALVLLFGGAVEVQLGIAEAETVDLSAWVVPLIAYAVAGVVVCVALLMWCRSRAAGNIDLRTEVMKATLRMMVERPRFGVERSTPMESVMLRARYVPGTQWSAVVCRSKRYRFSDDDFMGMVAGDFGGQDMMTESGHLVVFADEAAKAKYLERGHHG